MMSDFPLEARGDLLNGTSSPTSQLKDEKKMRWRNQVSNKKAKKVKMKCK